MFNKLKQYNDLRKQANSLKSKLAEETITVEHGAVRITIDGNQDIKNVTLDESQLTASNKNRLENDIKEANNQALKKIQRVMAEKMREMGGFNLPGMGGGNNQ